MLRNYRFFNWTFNKTHRTPHQNQNTQQVPNIRLAHGPPNNNSGWEKSISITNSVFLILTRSENERLYKATHPVKMMSCIIREHPLVLSLKISTTGYNGIRGSNLKLITYCLGAHFVLRDPCNVFSHHTVQDVACSLLQCPGQPAAELWLERLSRRLTGWHHLVLCTAAAPCSTAGPSANCSRQPGAERGQPESHSRVRTHSGPIR